MLNGPKICALLILLVLVSALTACFLDGKTRTDEEMIQDRLDAFLIAYNSGDFDGVLACMDARTRNQYESLRNMMEGIGFGWSGFGFSASGHLDFGDLFGFAVGTIADGDLMEVEILSMALTDVETARVHTSMKYKVKYGETTSDLIFTFVKEDGDWFIQDLSDA